ncbi:MAG: hybrid sensor histidine kinase/response regulator, partial [Deltaproteobacteria bacterium]|nr:hybrid sensor histidine kinase/response regulator [Deltaproteobacteria bacterium]
MPLPAIAMTRRAGMPLPAIAMTRRAGAMLVLLVLLGFLGNFYALPLFFGADFLFGSIAVLLVLYFYGLGWGLLAAAVVNSYTYVLWGHPYGFIMFMLEALVVGYLLRSGRRNLFLLDGLFWLLIGLPLNVVFYFVAMHMDAVTTSFIVLKQGINGIFNALLAGLAINHLPLDRLLGRPPARRTFSLQEGLFNLMAALVLVPALLLTVMEIRGEMAQTERTIETDLQTVSRNIQAHLHFWYRQHVQAVTVLAG